MQLIVLFLIKLASAQVLSNWSCPSESQINFCWTSNWFSLPDCYSSYNPYVIQNPTIYNRCPVCLSCRPKSYNNCSSLLNYEHCINNIGDLPVCENTQSDLGTDPCCLSCRKQCVTHNYLPICTDTMSTNIYGCHICRKSASIQLIKNSCDLSSLPICSSELELINSCPVCEPYILHHCSPQDYEICNLDSLPTCPNYFKNKVNPSENCCPVCLSNMIYQESCTDDEIAQCFANQPLCEDGIEPLYLSQACCSTCKKVELECSLEQLTECFNSSLVCLDQAIPPHLSKSCCRSCYHHPLNNNCSDRQLSTCKFVCGNYLNFLPMSQIIFGAVRSDLIEVYNRKCFLKEELEIGIQFSQPQFYQKAGSWNLDTWSFLLQQVVFKFCQNSQIHSICRTLEQNLGSIWVETVKIYNTTTYQVKIAVPQVPTQINVIQNLLKNSLQNKLASLEEINLCIINTENTIPYHQDKLFITGMILGVCLPILVIFIIAIIWAMNTKEVKLSRPL